MKQYQYIPAILAIILLCGCGGSTSAPLDADRVRAVILQNIDIIEAGINAEDIFLASQPISDEFTMDNNVATRYSTEWTDKGIGTFRNFWNVVFIADANIEFRLELQSLDVVGDIATAQCASDYTSQRPDIVPPEIKVATDNDYLQFEREAGRWLLRRWEVRDPSDPPGPHNEGGGGSV